MSSLGVGWEGYEGGAYIPESDIGEVVHVMSDEEIVRDIRRIEEEIERLTSHRDELRAEQERRFQSYRFDTDN